MSAWPDLQAAFGAAMLTDDPAAPDGALAALVRADRLSADARLRIYRHHVLTTLSDALRSAYPVVTRLVGDGFFAYAADRYVRVHPPGGPCLFEYGDSFPAFLASFPPCRSLEYLPDVARLEWALHVAAHAPDATGLDAEGLRGLRPADAGRLVVRFHPSVSLLVSSWPVDRVWLANRPDGETEEPVDLGAGGVRLEVRRVDDEPGFRPLAPGPFALRRALADGRPLADAADLAVAADPTLDLALALHDLLRDGVLVGFAVASPTEDTP
jgi:hypothetical protein